jgi:hypothetical protein
MAAGFTLCFYWLLLKRLQSEILSRELGARWVNELIVKDTG